MPNSAREMPGSGYRRLTTYGGFGGGGATRGCGRKAGWTSAALTLDRRLGTPDTTAQIDPAGFTRGLMRRAEAHGATASPRRAPPGLVRDGDRVTGVLVGAETIEADAVVIAMGPWSILAAAWLPLPAVYGLKGHSIVYRTGDAMPAEALFLEVGERGGGTASPEVFPRPDGTTYVCAISSDSPLPVDPAAVAPDPGAIDRLAAIAAGISPILAEAPVTAAQACFRPVTADGLPLIGAVPDVDGAYRRDRPQRLGHAQRAGDRRGDGRTDPRRPLAGGRPRALRSRPAAAVRRLASAGS